MKRMVFLFAFAIALVSCRSVDFNQLGTEAAKDEKEYSSYKDELDGNYNEMQDYLVQEKLKEVDVPKTIVYVDRPIYYPAEEESDRPKLNGKDAAMESTKQALQQPHKFTNGLMYYDFDDDFTYEIYCQPYRVTDISLEPGEQVIEMPFLSEEKVWEVGAGVSQKNGVDTQHFFIKPAYSGLVTSLILITDKRVYHMLLKSFKDCYMTQVRWEYPNTMPFTVKTDAMTENINRLKKETVGVDPAFLSFDYKMSYSVFKKPYWLPTRVYDDGKKTYITMDETVLHMTSPVLFNNKNERINYSVSKNLIVINELIEKVTLRVGKEKVTVTKQKYKASKDVKVPKDADTDEVTLEDENALTDKKKKPSYIDSINSKNTKETMLHSSDLIIEKNETEATSAAQQNNQQVKE